MKLLGLVPPTLSVLGAAGVAHQYSLNIGGDFGRHLLAFLISQTGQGVLGNHKLEVGHSHHPSHGLGRIQKNVGDNRGSGNTNPLHLDSVVHTARATGASITNPGDQNVHFVQRLLDNLRLAGQRGVVLAEIHHIL